MKIKKITKKKNIQSKKYYDIEVEEHHNFFITKSNVVTHNSSLESTTVGMAQTFINSNNINLLEPKGQFGTRTHGGSDASASRYIFTKLNKITNNIFIKSDENVLNYLDDDGFPIEPDYYVPIVPMLLVNGSKGIGSGYSTDIPKFNVRDIIKHLKVRLSDKHNRKLLEPYYEKFKGEIVENSEQGKFITRGTYRKVNDNEIIITELPIGTWTENYHTHLDKLIENKTIKDYIKRSNNKDINIVVIFNRGDLLKLENSGDFYKMMNLESTVSYNNMMAFDKDGKLKKYNTPEEIIDDFYDVRLEYYQKRKDYILAKYEFDKKVMYNRIKFIRALLDDDIILKNKKKNVLIKELKLFGLEELGSFDGTVEANFDYLLNMRFINLTNEKLHELKDSYTEVLNKIKQIQETDIKDMWIEDLDNLMKLV